MGERIAFGVAKGRLRLTAGKRREGMRSVPRDLVGSLWTRVATQRLISSPNAANCRDLREDTQLILSTLTDHEQGVLRMLFGIGDVVLGRYLRGGVTLLVGIALTVYLVRATAVTPRYPRDMMGVSR